MAIWGDNKASEAELEQARSALQASEKARKRLAAELATAQQHAAALAQQIAGLQAEVEKARAAVLKSRKRQRASVDRANRFKSKLEAASG